MTNMRRLTGYAAGCIIKEFVEGNWNLKKRPIPEPERQRRHDFETMRFGEFMDKHEPQKSCGSEKIRKFASIYGMPGPFPGLSRIAIMDVYRGLAEQGITLDVQKTRECPNIDLKFDVGKYNWWSIEGETMKFKTEELKEKLKAKREEFVKLADKQANAAQQAIHDQVDRAIEAIQGSGITNVNAQVYIPAFVNKTQQLMAYDALIAKLELCADEAVELNENQLGNLLCPDNLFNLVSATQRSLQVTMH